METKAWYTSRTLWANAIAILGGALAKFTGVEIDSETAVGLLGLVNIVLRVVTKSGLSTS